MNIFGFWLFLATVVVAVTWSSIHRRRTKHDMLKLVMEKEEQITPELIDRIMGEKSEPTITVPVSMKLNIVGVITMLSGIGLLVLSYFIGIHDAESRLGLLGTGAFVILISLGILFASVQVKKQIEDKARALTDNTL